MHEPGLQRKLDRSRPLSERSTMRTRFALFAAALALLATAAPAAAEKPYENFTYAETFEGTFDACGMTIDFVDTSSGHLLTKVVKSSDGQAFLAHNNYRFRTVYTNTATGRSMVWSGRGTFKEVHATHVEGDIWEFTWQDAGQPLKITDLEGNILAFERGRVSGSILFDTLGDGQPGGDLLSESEPVFHGQFETGHLGFCDFAEMFIS
jgi:YD repeat-containing protein